MQSERGVWLHIIQGKANWAKLRDWGIGELKDKINKIKKIEFLQFLNPSIPISPITFSSLVQHVSNRIGQVPHDQRFHYIRANAQLFGTLFCESLAVPGAKNHRDIGSNL